MPYNLEVMEVSITNHAMLRYWERRYGQRRLPCGGLLTEDSRVPLNRDVHKERESLRLLIEDVFRRKAVEVSEEDVVAQGLFPSGATNANYFRFDGGFFVATLDLRGSFATGLCPTLVVITYLTNESMPRVGGDGFMDAFFLRCSGYDSHGFNARGFSRERVHRETGTTRDPDGFDVRGRDTHGRDRDGYDRDGRDAEGYDREGYYWDGFNRDGLNRWGRDKSSYDPNGSRRP